jgi:hypothetical protein
MAIHSGRVFGALNEMHWRPYRSTGLHVHVASMDIQSNRNNTVFGDKTMREAFSIIEEVFDEVQANDG